MHVLKDKSCLSLRSLGTLALFVLIIAGVLGVNLIVQRRNYYLTKARHFRSRLDNWPVSGVSGHYDSVSKAWQFETKWVSPQDREQILELCEKYTRASKRPWNNVAPDPPPCEPEWGLELP